MKEKVVRKRLVQIVISETSTYCVVNELIYVLTLCIDVFIKVSWLKRVPLRLRLCGVALMANVFDQPCVSSVYMIHFASNFFFKNGT